MKVAKRMPTMVPTMSMPATASAAKVGSSGVMKRRKVKPTANGDTDSQQTGSDHLPQGALGHEIDAGAVIRLFRIVHDAGMLAELAANFFDDGLRRLLRLP